MPRGIELQSTTEKGDGVFTTRQFKAGETVMVGVIETRLSENHSHASQVGEHQYVFHAGLISKFNHSCEPNCGIRVNASGGHDFIAMRDIKPNEEATFDYAMRNLGVDHFPGDCTCGEKACRGSITGWRDLPQARKDQYLGFVAPYLLELDAKTEGVVRAKAALSQIPESPLP
ncbi:MAG: SET domain-containing protein-lysine N-methyltransferase [Pseudomonadota bacterium]